MTRRLRCNMRRWKSLKSVASFPSPERDNTISRPSAGITSRLPPARKEKDFSLRFWCWRKRNNIKTEWRNWRYRKSTYPQLELLQNPWRSLLCSFRSAWRSPLMRWFILRWMEFLVVSRMSIKDDCFQKGKDFHVATQNDSGQQKWHGLHNTRFEQEHDHYP